MNRWRTLLCILLVLWLPAQGYGAVAMPFCQHGMGGGTSVLQGNDSDHSRHQRQGHSSHTTQPEHSEHFAGTTQSSHDTGNVSADPNGILGCDNCGTCHLACAPAISAIAPLYLLVGTADLEPAPADAPYSFYPEQLQRPPLLALA